MTKNFIGEKERWANKGNDKHEDADSLLHNTRSHTQCLYQISKSCAFDIFQKVVFCLTLFTEVNLQTFVMI